MDALHKDLDVMSNPCTISEEDDALMYISSQALHGTESSRSTNLRGWVQNKEMLMLVDSGSTHSFIDEQMGTKLLGVQIMPSPLKVQIADGGQLPCS